jgi:signal transduction histidine kinase
MRRHLLAGCVALADTALLAAGHRGGLPLWVMPGYALAVVLVIAWGSRAPLPALVAALALASLTGGSYVLLLWAAYQAGRGIVSRRGMEVAVGAVLGCAGVQAAARPPDARMLPTMASAYLVFVGLPLLAGRYLAQHERLVTALHQRNQHLQRSRAFEAEQERLRERLRIARDMHDCLGQRLSLVSIQAAALQVAPLPPQQRAAIGQLAAAARGALDDLQGVVGMLRSEDAGQRRPSPAEAMAAVAAEFRAAGVQVMFDQQGDARPLDGPAAEASYRLVQEGLTNAAKHARGQPVTVRAEWRPDSLLITISNDVPVRPAGTGAGHGLRGLAERAEAAGGFLDYGPSGGQFRLFAMLPAATEADGPEPPAASSIRTAALGLATGVLMFLALPASLLLGVR